MLPNVVESSNATATAASNVVIPVVHSKLTTSTTPEGRTTTPTTTSKHSALPATGEKPRQKNVVDGKRVEREVDIRKKHTPD